MPHYVTLCDLQCSVCGTNILIFHALLITIPVPMALSHCNEIHRWLDYFRGYHI